jgi:2-succinyl-5-enolpyruvyl-6-hydroxy-3-cyclohexene-1-carboxylate synthase
VTITPDKAAYAFVGAFVDELARAGVRHVCIAPGSRSTPLALTIADHPGLRSWVHLDERSGAFFALGMARALGEPVALICTSGTAAANFFPAVVEANAAGVPLIVLTADRPPELREVGAGQTIDQNHLYGAHAKWFVEVALPEASPEMLRYARTLAARTAATARSIPAGPVHLNFPFREPLVPSAIEPSADLESDDLLAWRGRPDNAPWVAAAAGSMVVDPTVVDRLATLLLDAKRPLIVCGPQTDDALASPLGDLARTIGAPLLADPLSQVRWGAHDRSTLIDRYDAILRHPASAAALAPDLIVRLGAVPTSKALFQWIDKQVDAQLIVVDPARWPDPSLRANEMIQADPTRLCQALFHATSMKSDAPSASDWLKRWESANDVAGGALVKYASSLAEPFEGAALAEIVTCLPDRATLFVSSSMPVRDLDTFGEGDARAIRVIANRGANGIDGVVSSALGVAAALRDSKDGPLVLAIGDIAFYHDMNGLLAARLHSLDATIVVINNDGGGIFSFLPQASNGKHFEKLFGTPHGLQFSAAAALYGASYHLAPDTEALRRAITAGIEGKGLHIVEFRTDRARNVALHREAVSAVASALAH